MDRRTAVIILSDGWDTGDPDMLSHAMARIRRRAFAVLWLNPLMGSPGFRPETEGMLAALPHIDLLAPAHNVAALRDLAKSLGRLERRGTVRRPYAHLASSTENESEPQATLTGPNAPSSIANLRALEEERASRTSS